jgi:hypothetical protein
VSGAAPFRALDTHLDEGDILSDAPLLKWDEDGTPTAKPSRVIVTSNGCTCEDYERDIAAGRDQKARKRMVMVAPLRNVSSYPEDIHAAIQNGEFYDRFYVFGDGARLQDQVVDLTREYHVPAAILANCTKVARLANWQWRRLLVQIAVSRFHQPPEEIFIDPRPQGT